MGGCQVMGTENLTYWVVWGTHCMPSSEVSYSGVLGHFGYSVVVCITWGHRVSNSVVYDVLFDLLCGRHLGMIFVI